jgi:Na+/H+ antiporter NhaA
MANPATINAAKMSILIASLTAGILGFLWLASQKNKVSFGK